MALISSILQLLLLFMNVFQTFKTLKPPTSSRSKTRGPSIRAISQRKRDMKGLLTMWIVWSCLFAYERSAERFIRIFVPFYGEIKSILLLLLTLTRARSSEPIYLHFIRPTIKPYVSTLDPIVNTLVGACDFVLFIVSIPFQQSSESYASHDATSTDGVIVYPTIPTPEIEEKELMSKTGTTRTRHPLRTASSKATLSTMRPDSGDRRPSLPHPRRLQSESAANIASQQFWYPPSPAQSSPETRSVPLPTPSFHVQSASDSATLHQPTQRGPSPSNILNHTPEHTASEESESSDDDEVLETPRRPLGVKRRNLSTMSPEDTYLSDEYSASLRTPLPQMQMSRHPSELPEDQGLGDDLSDTVFSTRPYSAVLSTDGHASSLCTQSESESSSDVNSTGPSDSGISSAGKRKRTTAATLRPSTRQATLKLALNKNSSGTLTKGSLHSRHRQPATFGTRMLQISQQQIAQGSSTSSAGEDEESNDDADEERSAESEKEHSEFGILDKQSHLAKKQRVGANMPEPAEPKSVTQKQPEEKRVRPVAARTSTIARRNTITRANTVARASTLNKTVATATKRPVAPPMVSKTSSRGTRSRPNVQSNEQ